MIKLKVDDLKSKNELIRFYKDTYGVQVGSNEVNRLIT